MLPFAFIPADVDYFGRKQFADAVKHPLGELHCLRIAYAHDLAAARTRKIGVGAPRCGEMAGKFDFRHDCYVPLGGVCQHFLYIVISIAEWTDGLA